jgi:hypothetical protein
MRPWQKAYAQARDLLWELWLKDCVEASFIVAARHNPTMKDPKKFKAFIDARYEA